MSLVVLFDSKSRWVVRNYANDLWLHNETLQEFGWKRKGQLPLPDMKSHYSFWNNLFYSPLIPKQIYDGQYIIWRENNFSFAMELKDESNIIRIPKHILKKLLFELDIDLKRINHSNINYSVSSFSDIMFKPF